MAVQIEVWGDYALFTRPELKVERVTYDVITPSAARGILDSIYYHPGFHWWIRKIYVMSPIKYMTVRRNEVSSKVSAKAAAHVMLGESNEDLSLYAETDRQPRSSLLLRDVRYIFEAQPYFEHGNAANNDTEQKIYAITERRIKKGQCYSQPYFGCREFTANYRAWEGGSDIVTAYPTETRDFGFMLYDNDYTVSTESQKFNMFFRARMVNGVIDVPAPWSEEVLR